MCGATYYNIREMSDMYIFININLFVLYKYQISSYTMVIFPNVAPHFFWDTLYIKTVETSLRI